MENQINPTPTAVKVIGWLMLVGGILGLLGSIVGLWIGAKAGGTNLLLASGMGGVVGSILAIVFSLGFLKMKKWALYSFTALFIIELVTMFYTDHVPIVEVLVLVYFWVIRKKFV
jgi:hypothetical protein